MLRACLRRSLKGLGSKLFSLSHGRGMSKQMLAKVTTHEQHHAREPQSTKTPLGFFAVHKRSGDVERVISDRVARPSELDFERPVVAHGVPCVARSSFTLGSP